MDGWRDGGTDGGGLDRQMDGWETNGGGRDGQVDKRMGGRRAAQTDEWTMDRGTSGRMKG